MVKVMVFGACSGTEAVKDFHHTALAVKINESYFWFDAGEDCVWSANMMDVEFEKIKGIFISHQHIDHNGGLLSLLHSISKREFRYGIKMTDGKIRLFMPDMKIGEHFVNLLPYLGIPYRGASPVETQEVKDGLVFGNEDAKIYAHHNHHIQSEEGDGWRSYSYVIEGKDKRIVFSGDVRDMYDLDGLLEKETDLLLVETGHHKVADVCDYVNSKKIKKCVFIHHGRQILENFEECEKYVKEHMNCPVEVSKDRTIYEV